MLLQFSCSNFKSIKDTITFSMLASNDETDIEFLLNIEGSSNKYLPMAVIYGANGSGKSKFLNALLFAKNQIKSSYNNPINEPIPCPTHHLTEHEPTKMNFHFITNKNHYQYGFSIKEGCVLEEELYSYPNNQEKLIFQRNVENNSLKFGSSLSENEFTLSIQALKNNRLFLSCGANFSPNIFLTEAYNFFDKDLVFYFNTPYLGPNWLQFSLSFLKENTKVKESFINFLRLIGHDIKDIIISPKQIVNRDDNMQNDGNFNTSSKKNLLEAKIKYNNTITDLITEESTGIKKLFEFFTSIYISLKYGKVFFIDEIENSLHEVLVYHILDFVKHCAKVYQAQLIFTTHNSNLLSKNLFRKDQIWFTEITNEHATDIYSLEELKEIHQNENFEFSYIEGRYGGIPLLNENFLQEFSTEIHKTIDNDTKAEKEKGGK